MIRTWNADDRPVAHREPILPKSALELDPEKAKELEEKFDSEIRFRPLAPAAGWIVGTLLVVLSLFHYYTAGFGLLPEMVHRGIHLSFVLGLDLPRLSLHQARLRPAGEERRCCARSAFRCWTGRWLSAPWCRSCMFR